MSIFKRFIYKKKNNHKTRNQKPKSKIQLIKLFNNRLKCCSCVSNVSISTSHNHQGGFIEQELILNNIVYSKGV